MGKQGKKSTPKGSRKRPRSGPSPSSRITPEPKKLQQNSSRPLEEVVLEKTTNQKSIDDFVISSDEDVNSIERKKIHQDSSQSSGEKVSGASIATIEDFISSDVHLGSNYVVTSKTSKK